MKVNKHVIAMLMFAMIFMNLPGSGHAQANQSEASLEETLSWLREKLKTYGNYTFADRMISADPDVDENRTVRTTSPSNFEGCRITLRTSFVDYYYKQGALVKKRDEVGAVATIPLSDLDPDKIEVTHITNLYNERNIKTIFAEEWRISFQTANEKESIEGYPLEGSTPPTDGARRNKLRKAKGFDLYIKTEDAANRIAKAFRHAIVLCGGKAEPF